MVHLYGSTREIDDLSALTGTFVARGSAFVGTGDDRVGRALFWPAADATFTSVFAVPSGATPSEIPPRAPTPPSEASVALLPTGRISTRTHRRTVAAAGAAQPVVEYGFGHGKVPRTSPSRVDPPPRVPRPRLPLTAAPITSRAPTPVPTVPIRSDRDRAEPLGAPILGFRIRYPPLRPIWKPSALLPNYTLAISLRVICTPTGRESNAQSLPPMPPSKTFFSARHWPCPPRS